MDLLKSKIFLDKINREFARMNKDPENIVRLDVDIMLSYVRDFYDALLSNGENPAPPVRVPVRPAEPKEPPAPVAAQPAPPPKPPVAEPAPPPEDKPAPAPPPPPVVVEPIKTEEPLPTIKPKSPAPVSFPAIPPEAEGLFEHKEATELSEKLSNLPIPDLRKAVTLNDRLLLTRELFADDNGAFDKALETINSLADFDAAKDYLLEHCVMRYRWTEKKRLETARKFIKMVRRRFSS